MPFDYTKYLGLIIVGNIYWDTERTIEAREWDIEEEEDGIIYYIYGFSKQGSGREIVNRKVGNFTMNDLFDIMREYRVHKLIDYILANYKLSSLQEDYVIKRVKEDFNII